MLIYFSGFPLNRCLYTLCSVIGIMLIHQSLDAIAKYFNSDITFNFRDLPVEWK